jgi:signal transduction histidine kinase/ActR/RegA family two-component response regulator
MMSPVLLHRPAVDLAATVAVQAAELAALREELVETNRGVVALYAELDDKFRMLYAKARGGICLLDADGLIVDANPALLLLLRRDLHSVVGRRVSDFVAPDWVDGLASAAATAWQAEFPLVDAAGARVHVEWSVSPFVEEGMRIAMATDVSERVLIHQARLELLEREQAARQEAERVNRLKDDLIAVLSHELRTPLNAIMSWTHVLQQQGGADITLRGLKAIERNGKAQARLIADILDMSSINMDKLQLAHEWCDPGELVRSALEDLREQAATRGVELVSTLASPLRAVHADVGRVRQIVWNLVGNAIKFCQPGGRVEISLVESADALHLCIADNGRGVDPGFLPYLFERFSQGEAAATRTRGGLGLGLSIVKHLVELHGGTIVASSAGLGLGCRFDIRLPTQPAQDGVGVPLAGAFVGLPDDLPADLLRGVRILLVDDDRDGLAALEIVLADRGARVEIATSVDAGLLLMADFAPDVLLSDIGMPGKDGHALVREIRRTERPGSRVAAIALTAFSRKQDIDQVLAAGFDAHCAKPLRPLELLRLIARVAQLHERGSADKSATS